MTTSLAGSLDRARGGGEASEEAGTEPLPGAQARPGLAWPGVGQEPGEPSERSD